MCAQEGTQQPYETRLNDTDIQCDKLNGKDILTHHNHRHADIDTATDNFTLLPTLTPGNCLCQLSTCNPP